MCLTFVAREYDKWYPSETLEIILRMQLRSGGSFQFSDFLEWPKW